MERLVLAPGLAAEITAHALECYPEEACGIIAGSANAGITVHHGRNVSKTPLTAFELDPETLTRQLEFEDAGLRMVAVYHSHPSGPAWPSALDVGGAAVGYPDSLMLLCSLANLEEPVLRSFRIVQDRVRPIALGSMARTCSCLERADLA